MISFRGYDSSFLASMNMDTEISSKPFALLLLSLPIMDEINEESTLMILSLLRVCGRQKEVYFHYQTADTVQQSTS